MDSIIRLLYQHTLVCKLPLKQTICQKIIGRLTGNYEIILCEATAPYFNLFGYHNYIYPLKVYAKLCGTKNNGYKLYNSKKDLLGFFIRETLIILKEEGKYYIKRKLKGNDYDEYY